jgi:hypothetical protein
MTRIFLDDKEIASPRELSSLDQILKYIEDTHLSSDCVIRNIKLDGLPLVVDDWHKEFPESVREIGNREKIEILTGSVIEIAVESITESMAYLDRIERLTPSLAESFQISPGPEAYENLRHLYEGFYCLNTLLEKLQARFDLKIEDIPISKIPVRQHLQKFASILKELIQSQEQRDFVLMSDLLQYEIYPLIPVWKEMFGICFKKLRPTG